MRIVSTIPYVIALSALITALAGCDAKPSSSVQPPAAGDPHSHGDEHTGPHGGHVIELGRSHEYHAEIVEDDHQQSVAVYILGNDLNELPIEAAKLVMSLMVEGEPKTFELVAANASDGKASHFDAADATLFEALHDHEGSGRLSATINGTPYVGVFDRHDHDLDHRQGHDDEPGHDQDSQAHGDDHER